MKIAVLMTCYNRVNTTVACLDTLFKQRGIEDCQLDVWLVDDGSPDKTGEKIKREFPKINVIHSEGGLFWCKGMRLAWDKAVDANDYDFYLWLNDDVLLKADAIANLLSDYEKTKSIVVGTFSSNEGESEVSYGATNKIPDCISPKKGICGMNGNLVLISREIFKQVGPICSKYHHQYGDYDYGWLLRRKGFEYYSSSHFSGVCPQQPERYLHLKGRSFIGRIKLLFQPKGYCIHDAYLYKRRNWGLVRALISVCHITLKVVFGIEK